MLSVKPVLLIVGLLSVWSVSECSVDVGLDRYEDMLMQNLYKRLSQIDSSYLNPSDLDLDLEGKDEYRSARDDEQGEGLGRDGLVGGESSSAAIRDSEYIQHSSNFGSDGFIYMSGGAGEGKQHLTPDGSLNNLKTEGHSEVKSDESLPFYCHPSNPCPKGYTSTDGCQEDVEDTADAQRTWITNMQSHGYCPCDHEHMVNCPDTGVDMADRKEPQGTRDQALSEAVNKILADQAAATYMSGEKRQTLVAKKSPRIKRSVSHAGKDAMEQELSKVSEMSKKRNNPYLQGQRLRTVAKKG